MEIDGKALAQSILDNLKQRVIALEKAKEIIPHLAIIRVGDDPATTSYVNQKERMAKSIGAVVSIYSCPEAISEKEVLESIDFLQAKGDIHGLIVQLPLPHHIREEMVVMAVNNAIDVDGFKPNSQFIEPIAAAVLRILGEIHKLDMQRMTFHEELKEFTYWLSQHRIVVMGKGKTGGKPIIHILKKMGITPTIIDSKTPNREEIIGTADVLICAVGNKGILVTAGMIKKNAIIIGIGMHRGADGKLHGDYDCEDIKEKAGYYTPIPGGVGPVNAAMLLDNVVTSAEH